MFKLRLLIVEDEEVQLDTYRMKIELMNAEKERHGFLIEPTIAESLQEAEEAISLNDFDAAIIDLRLKVDHGSMPNDHGNDVLKLVLENEIAVVAIFSAETTVARVPDEYSSIIELFRKGEADATENILSWLSKHSGLIKYIKDSQRIIRKEMARLFNKSIWPRWTRWLSESSEESFIKNSLTRHLTSYVYASFLEQSNNKVHPEEWYFIPPIREGIKTGDIIKNDTGVIEVVITPRCDLARTGKNETYQLVECKVVAEEWTQLLAKLESKKVELQTATNHQQSESKKRSVDKALEEIRQFTQHKNNTSTYHFLPKIHNIKGQDYGPFLVNFDKLRSIKRDDPEAEASLTKSRIAAISPEFLPSLVERLGAFFSRFGTPDYSHHD